MPDTDSMVGKSPLYAMIAVALLQRREELRHGPYAAQVTALDALLSLLTQARAQAVRKGKLQDALLVKSRRHQEVKLS